MKSNKKNNITRAVIYARFSSHGQREESIEGQLAAAHEYAKRENITVIAEYIDRAKTGRQDDRPEFQRMIKDAAKGQFQIVLVWMLDRFSRNRYDSAIYKNRLRKYGVRVVSVKENITDGPEGIILEGVLEALAEYYSANLATNIKRGQQANIEKGKHCGGHVPFGYKSVDGRFIADERNAPILQNIFKLYSEGKRKKEIVEWLSSIGARTYSGKSFAINSFDRMLKNTTYIGQLIRGGELIEGAAEALIDMETFNKVQKRLKANARAPGAGNAKVNYLLQGKLYCGQCGNNMIGESGTNAYGSTYNYYNCSLRKRKNACDKKIERKNELENYVVSKTIDYILSPGMIEKIASAVVKQYEKEFNNSNVAELERLLERLNKDMNNLVNRLAEAPESAVPLIYEKMDATGTRIADIEIDITKLRIASNIRYTKEEIISILNKMCKGDAADYNFRCRIIDTFINSIYVYDHRIIVFYNIRIKDPVAYDKLCSTLPPSPSASSSEIPSSPSSPSSKIPSSPSSLSSSSSPFSPSSPSSPSSAPNAEHTRSNTQGNTPTPRKSFDIDRPRSTR